MAILCVHRLALPEDILSFIKDFAFPSLERKRIMDTHKQIHAIVIQHADLFEDEYIIQNDEFSNRAWFFWGGIYQKNCLSFYMTFCKKCGDYYSPNYRGEPAVCLC